jgi:hypothetical protein
MLGKGFDTSIQVNSPAKLNDFVKDIQAAARAIGIQDLNINNFINPEDERVVDSTNEITDLIVAQFNLTNQEAKAEVEVEATKAIVPAVTTAEAIKALNI